MARVNQDMLGSIDIETLRGKRWFMGKSRPVDSVRVEDSVEIGGTELAVLGVAFSDGGDDKYAFVKDEGRMGAVLAEALGGAPSRRVFAGKSGQFVFTSTEAIDAEALQKLKTVSGEQSNSSFIAPGHSFFKLYRRLQQGTHPEPETLRSLEGQGIAPRLLGECTYKDISGSEYALGILEQLVPNARDAWEWFCEKMDPRDAAGLGQATARMHAALKTLPGTAATDEEPPFGKLENLLRASDDPLAKDVLAALPSLRDSFAQQRKLALGLETGALAPQRVHGDFHLGQVLVGDTPGSDPAGEDDRRFTILDFEGEPSRTLAYRRRLRSPAVDIAGMLRSFRYAAATSGRDSKAAEDAFLEHYARERHINTAKLRAAAQPHVIAKAVYEACYELEFRPDWFHIPAKALL